MLQEQVFPRDSIMPSWWANAIQRVGSLTFGGVALRLVNATTVAVPAGADQAAAVMVIGGQWRYNEAETQRSHPGGAAGIYAIWAAAKAQDVRNAPALGTDFTDRSWTLLVTADGVEPTPVVDGVQHFRRIGRCTWSGTEITSLVQELGTVEGQMIADNAIRAATNELVVTRQADGGLLLSLDPQRRDAEVPIGSMVPFTGTVSPTPATWGMAIGTAVSRGTYAALWAVYGGASSPWGLGDGSSTFNLPDTRGRTLIGAGQGSGLSSRVLATKYGFETVALGVEHLAAHNHAITDNGHFHPITDNGHSHYESQLFWGDDNPASPYRMLTTAAAPAGTAGVNRGRAVNPSGTGIVIQSRTTGIVIQSRGGGAAHENMQPSLATNFLIRMK